MGAIISIEVAQWYTKPKKLPQTAHALSMRTRDFPWPSYSPLLILIGIKRLNRAALLGFPNVTGPKWLKFCHVADKKCIWFLNNVQLKLKLALLCNTRAMLYFCFFYMDH